MVQSRRDSLADGLKALDAAFYCVRAQSENHMTQSSANSIFFRLLLPLSVLMAFSGALSAQVSPGDGDGTPQPAQTDGTILQAPAPPSSSAQKINTKAPTTAGRWVPRVDAKTCPKGSTAYLDDKNGGVKCWVNDN